MGTRTEKNLLVETTWIEAGPDESGGPETYSDLDDMGAVDLPLLGDLESSEVGQLVDDLHRDNLCAEHELHSPTLEERPLSESQIWQAAYQAALEDEQAFRHVYSLAELEVPTFIEAESTERNLESSADAAAGLDTALEHSMDVGLDTATELPALVQAEIPRVASSPRESLWSRRDTSGVDALVGAAAAPSLATENAVIAFGADGRFEAQLLEVDEVELDVADFSEAHSEIIDLAKAPAAPTVMRGLVQQLHELRERGDWPALARALSQRAAAEKQPAARAAVLREAARVYHERLGNLIAARSSLLQAFEIEPSDNDTAEALERVASESGQWIELVAAYDKAARTAEPELASMLRLRTACAHVLGTGDAYAAQAALQRVQTVNPVRAKLFLDILEDAAVSREALTSLIRLCQSINDRERLPRILSRAIAVSQSLAERASYHHLIGEIECDGGDMAAAEWHLVEALRLDPSLLPVRDLLSSMYRRRGEFREAAQLLEQARACTADLHQRAELACEAAEIYEKDLGERTHALDLYAAALEMEPGHEKAARPIVDRYFAQERWAELEPIAEALVARYRQALKEPEDIVDLYYKAGEASLRLEHFAKARQHFSDCIVRDENRVDALIGAAKAHLGLQAFAQAIDYLGKALARQRDRETIASRLAETLYLKARAHRALGQLADAEMLYRECVGKGHVESLAELVELYAHLGRVEEIIELRLAAAQRMDDGQRAKILAEVAGILFKERKDARGAIELCRQALEIEPENRALLHQLTELYTAVENWREAVKTIVRMAKCEKNPLRRAKYLQAAAVMAARRIGFEESIAFLNQALECYFHDPSPESRARAFACFRDIVDNLGRRGDWEAVAKSYRDMIRRLDPGDPEVGGLWSDLGAVYRDKLGQRYAAISSYEVASALDAQRLTHHRILIDLYEGAGADQIDKAIERRRLLLEVEPFNADHYKALRSLYVRKREMDKVWCVCRALEHLQAADDREKAFYRRNLTSGIRWPSRPLNGDDWSRLRHEDADPMVSRVMGLVCEAVAFENAPPAHKIDMRDDRSAVYNQLRDLFGAAVYAFGLPGFPCYIQPHRNGDLMLANVRRGKTLEPSFVIGRSLYEGRTIQNMVHNLGRTLAYARRSYYLRLALCESELTAAFYAALSTVRPELASGFSSMPRVRTYRSTLRKQLHPTWLGKLAEVTDMYLRSGQSFDAARWGAGVDATARRAGLLLTGDLETALSSISGEPAFTAVRSHERKRRELLLHSISEEHFALRSELGLAIEP